MTTPPFFVLGSQRSGTTMLRLMINNHSRLAVPHETAFITSFLDKVPSYGDLADIDNRRHLLDDIAAYHLVERGGHIVDREAILARDATTFPAFVDAILSVYAESHGKQRWGDKTPYYTPDIDTLWQLFPGAKFIHLVRDGRDVLVSQRNIEWMSNSVPRLAEDWRWKTTVCHKVGTVIGPDHFLELRYEDLVTSPEPVLRRICEFLDEPFEPGMLEHAKGAGEVVPEVSKQWHSHSVQAPDTSKLYAWKHKLSVSDRIIFEQVAGDTLAMFGYELEGRASTLGSKLKNLYYSTVVRW